MQERLDYVTLQPKRILDLGCSRGGSFAALTARYPDADLVGVDLSPAMLAAGLEALLANPLFNKVPPGNVRSMFQRMQSLVVEADQRIISQGELGDCCYFLKSGRAQVMRDEGSAQQVLAELAKRGIEWVQIDEPALVLELPPAWLEAFKPAYDALQGQVKLLLTTYFEGVSDNLETIAALPVQGLHVDLVHGKDDVAELHKRLPADWLLTAGLDTNKVIGLATAQGGPTSHTAILARSLDLPSVIATHTARQLIREDELIIVDGIQGAVIVAPDDTVLTEYRRRLRAWRVQKSKLASIKKANAQTADGTPVELVANIELPQDVPDALAAGATGVGLFRSEFLFLGRDSLPTEDEQFGAYREAAAAMNGLPVTIRTLDLGADKNPKWSQHTTADNPALGLCGIRLCLAEPMLFRTQLRAILRASHYGRIRVLFPMVNSVGELRQAVSQLELAKQELEAESIPFDRDINVGAMIEIPSAALTVNMLAKHVDFFSIGTNDLIQYTLAIDRSDEQVAHLYDPLHPAVLLLLAHVISSAEKAEKPVSMCGEMAGDPNLTRLLLGMGLRQFSMHPAQIPAVKQRIKQSDISELVPIVRRILRLEESSKIQEQIERLNLMQV